MDQTLIPQTPAPPLNPEPGPSDIHALDRIEQAFYLLKKMPARILFLYYLGTMPFVIGLLYFFNDMSKNAFAHEYALSAALGMAFLFVWCKFWQSAFCTRTYEYIGEYPRRSWSFTAVIQVITAQTVIHTGALILLPLASLILVPFAWTFAMYQMVLVQDTTDTGINSQLKKNFSEATKHTFFNHMLISILALFELFVFLNIAITIYTLPFLIKSLFGIESGFTMGGFNVFNTTFLLSAAGITHLLVDPLIKIIYTIQRYDDQSRKTGDDLISGLNRIKKTRRTSALIPAVLLFIFLAGPLTSYAADPPSRQAQPRQIHVDELDAAIKKVLSRREYTWRLPRDETKKIDEKQGFIFSALKWLGTRIKSASQALADWIESILEKIRNLFEKQPQPPGVKAPESLVKPSHLAAGLIVSIAVLLTAILLHIKRRHPEKMSEPKTTDRRVVDVNDENILADRLPEDQWMALAKDLLEKGDVRLAVRALYLGTLALLADRHFVKIARYKSNRDYQRELSFKTPASQTLVEDFIRMVQTVDSVWYGMHTIGPDIIDDFLSTQKRIMHEIG